MLRSEVLRAWTDQVPEGFRIVLKASRRITHRAKLRPDVREPLEYLLANVGKLEDRLGGLPRGPATRAHGGPGVCAAAPNRLF
jgi:uncharacterized protein YecE (DUF72 family)